MPWIDVDEPFATPPLSAGTMTTPDGSGAADLDDRWGSIEGVALEGVVDATACERIEIRGSILRGVTFETSGPCELDVQGCELVDCDLSTLRFRALTNTSMAGCKLSGCDFGEAIIRDLSLARCVLRLANLRMAKLERVLFTDCSLDDVEAYEAALTDVSFPGTTLKAFDVDQVRFTKVDLREAAELDLRSCRRLEGCLLRPEQIHELAFVLALASGASIERTEGA